MRNSIVLIALVLAAAPALDGCRRHSRAISAESHAPGTTMAKIAAPCAAYPPGAAGVVRTYCSGRATVTLTLAGVPHPLGGGLCAGGPGGFSLNLGVVSGPDLAGPKPDYVGLSVPTASGPFTGAPLTLVIDGKSYRGVRVDGQLGPGGGSFQGLTAKHKPVSGQFIC